MPKDKRIVKYGAVYVPEEKVKETAKRGAPKSSGKMDEIEEAIKLLQDLLTKNNRDNLDAMYNIDTDNLSASFRRLLSSYNDGIISANSAIETWANKQEAGFNAIAEWRSETTESIAAIEGKADANSASLTLISQWKNGVDESVAAVQTKASQNEAQITSIAKWKGDIDDDIGGLSESVAVIEQTADENGASISQIVSAVGSNGKVTTASIVAAINDSGSSVMIEADKIEMTGTTTFISSSENDDGELEIDGNSLAITIDGEDDWGNHDVESDNGINFYYQTSDYAGTYLSRMCRIYTEVDGDNSSTSSRYSVNIDTWGFMNAEGEAAYTALKLSAVGRMSLEANGVYIGSGVSLINPEKNAFITLDAGANTRVRAYLTYSQLESRSESYPSMDPSNGYCFCTDGIYYNGDKILSV